MEQITLGNSKQAQLLGELYFDRIVVNFQYAPICETLWPIIIPILFDYY